MLSSVLPASKKTARITSLSLPGPDARRPSGYTSRVYALGLAVRFIHLAGIILLVGAAATLLLAGRSDRPTARRARRGCPARRHRARPRRRLRPRGGRRARHRARARRGRRPPARGRRVGGRPPAAPPPPPRRRTRGGRRRAPPCGRRGATLLARSARLRARAAPDGHAQRRDAGRD